MNALVLAGRASHSSRKNSRHSSSCHLGSSEASTRKPSNLQIELRNSNMHTMWERYAPEEYSREACDRRFSSSERAPGASSSEYETSSSKGRSSRLAPGLTGCVSAQACRARRWSVHRIVDRGASTHLRRKLSSLGHPGLGSSSRPSRLFPRTPILKSLPCHARRQMRPGLKNNVNSLVTSRECGCGGTDCVSHFRK